MRCRAAVYLAAVILALLITWEITSSSFDVQGKARNDVLATAPLRPKCSLSSACPPDRVALYIRSGAADVVGPKICFDGKIVMSHVLNNVGPGLNIVVVNDGVCQKKSVDKMEKIQRGSGVVEKSDHLNMQVGNPEDTLAYLKEIKPGMIVLVASFDDVTAKMTKEMRRLFAGMGSALITSVGRRDSWVCAGRAGTENKSLFEKRAVNDERTNVYEGWPDTVEVGGCFQRGAADGPET